MSNSNTEDFKKKFFQAMSYVATTVNVVATNGPSGRAGVTVSAMSSVTADTPNPILLVCINERSAAAQSIIENGVFSVNILRDRQSYISDVFAGRYKDELEDKFDCTSWQSLQTGAPCVVDALVAFDCKIVSSKKVGSHHVFFGEVVDLALGEQGSALVYANRSYGAAKPIVLPAKVNLKGGVEESQASLGCFHTFAPYLVPQVLKRFANDGRGVSLDLVEGDTRRVQEALLSGEVELGVLYDFDLSPDLAKTVIAELKPYVLVSENHPLASDGPVMPSELASHAMISIEEQSSREKMEGILRSQGIEPNVLLHAASFEMMRGMIGAGLGFGIVMTKTAQMFSYDGNPLVCRELVSSGEPTNIVAAHRKGKELSQSTAELLSLLQTVAFL